MTTKHWLKNYKDPLPVEPILEQLISCPRCKTVENPTTEPKFKIFNRYKKDDNDGLYQPYDYSLRHYCPDGKCKLVYGFTYEELVNNWNNKMTDLKNETHS